MEVCSKATLHVVAIMDGITENAVTPPKLSMNNGNLEMITAVQKRKARLIKVRKSRSSENEHW